MKPCRQEKILGGFNCKIDFFIVKKDFSIKFDFLLTIMYSKYYLLGIFVTFHFWKLK